MKIEVIAGLFRFFAQFFFYKVPKTDNNATRDRSGFFKEKLFLVVIVDIASEIDVLNLLP